MWTVVISLVSIAIALASIVWQIVRYYRDGGRVKVRLDHVVWAPQQAEIANDKGVFSLPKIMKVGARYNAPIPPSFLELARVTVENPGRTAVSIIGPSFHLTGTNDRTHDVTLYRFNKEDPGNPAEEAPVRLEPFDIATFYFDFRPAVMGLAKTCPRLSMRAQVRVAGRHLFARSRLRRRWRIVEAEDSLYEDGHLDAETVIFQTLVRSRMSGVFDDDKPPVSMLCTVAKFLAGRTKEVGINLEELASQLRQVGVEFGYGRSLSFAAIELASQFKSLHARIVWPQQGLPVTVLPSELASGVLTKTDLHPETQDEHKQSTPSQQ